MSGLAAAHAVPKCVFFCIVGLQRRVTALWCPISHHPPSGAPPSCPAATRRALPNSTGEKVRTVFVAKADVTQLDKHHTVSCLRPLTSIYCLCCCCKLNYEVY